MKLKASAPNDFATRSLIGRSVRRMLLFLASVALVLVVLFVLDPALFSQLIRQLDVRNSNPFRAGDLPAMLSFVLIASLMIMLGAPRLIFFTLGGVSFGFALGLLWSLGACLIGSFLTFRIARLASRSWLSERFARQRLVSYITGARPSVLTVALMRFLPASNLAISIGLALGRIDHRTFLLGSAIGYLPQGVLAVLVGSGLANGPTWLTSTPTSAQMAITAALLLALIAWTWRAPNKDRADACACAPIRDRLGGAGASKARDESASKVNPRHLPDEPHDAKRSAPE